MQLGVSEKRVRGFCIPVRVYSGATPVPASSNTDWIMVELRESRGSTRRKTASKARNYPRARRPYREEYRAGNTGGFVVFTQPVYRKIRAE